MTVAFGPKKQKALLQFRDAHFCVPNFSLICWAETPWEHLQPFHGRCWQWTPSPGSNDTAIDPTKLLPLRTTQFPLWPGWRYLRVAGRDFRRDGPPVLLVGPPGGPKGPGHKAERRNGRHQGASRHVCCGWTDWGCLLCRVVPTTNSSYHVARGRKGHRF